MNNSYSPSRRQIFKTGLAAAGLVAFSGITGAMHPTSKLPPKSAMLLTGGLSDLRYPFTLPELPFGTDAFAPGIDVATMEIHHGKHHAGYVRKLNAALEAEPEWQSKPLGSLLANIDALPESIRTAVRNNGGGHANHSLYWATMRPDGSQPSGQLAIDIKRDFGSVDGLREKLKAAALGRFGSGWAWLAVAPSGSLIVRSSANQDSPFMQGQRPLFGIDV